jgi:ATP-dependent exoDNAse (exonuclease V) beta subunit
VNEGIERLAYALLRREECVGINDVAGTVADAVRMFQSVREHPEFLARRRDEWLFEVPFSFRGPGDATVLRGTIDCLTRGNDGSLTVFEFKTGRPSPEHRPQLDLYVAVIRELFPEANVEGRLIYS